MIFSAWQGEGNRSLKLCLIAGGHDGIVDLRRLAGGRGGQGAFADGRDGGLGLFAGGEVFSTRQTQSSLSIIEPTSMAQPLVLHLSTTSFIAVTS